eukprot:366131-Chlamydomonas_euryale.AAC.12
MNGAGDATVPPVWQMYEWAHVTATMRAAAGTCECTCMQGNLYMQPVRQLVRVSSRSTFKSRLCVRTGRNTASASVTQRCIPGVYRTTTSAHTVTFITDIGAALLTMFEFEKAFQAPKMYGS